MKVDVLTSGTQSRVSVTPTVRPHSRILANDISIIAVC